jgi:hypothetical protein
MTEQANAERAKNAWLTAAEVALVVAIVGLLVATWLPAMIGASPAEPPATRQRDANP